jgi:hypothetical protein
MAVVRVQGGVTESRLADRPPPRERDLETHDSRRVDRDSLIQLTIVQLLHNSFTLRGLYILFLCSRLCLESSLPPVLPLLISAQPRRTLPP